MKTVAERLKFAREKKGWSQSYLAVAAGVSQGTIGNIEAGIRQSRGSLPQIAEALEVSHKWLADGVGEMKPATKPAPPQGPMPTPLALELAWMFDKLTDRTDRNVAYTGATAAILKLLPGNNALPTQTPAQSASPKKQRV